MDKEIPLGLGMAFAENPEAMVRFSGLSPAEREKALQKAHGIRSKEEMRKFAAEIGRDG